MNLNIGTRSQLQAWLWNNHRLTYSAYAKLPTAEKLTLQASYQGRRQAREREVYLGIPTQV